MVFWSSFAKKIKQSVSQVSFDALKTRVSNVETKNQQQDTQISNINSTLQTNSTNIVNLNNVKADKTALEVVDNKVDGVITGLQNGNIVNYAGEWNSTTTYHMAQAVTYGGDWFVSNNDNNLNHTPTKTNNAYWVYISQPTVDLTPYLTIDNAIATYATISTINGLDARITTNQNNISSKADLSYLTNNFYNKTYIDNRKVKYKDITITRVVKDINLIANELWLGQFETNFEFSSYDYLVNNVIFYDILFSGATYTNWKHKVTASYSYTSGSTTRLGIKFLYTEQPTVKLQQNQIVRIWYSEEINR